HSSPVVAMLTHNVVVRSSGTDLVNNSAYIQNLVANPTSFVLAQGEFDYLGHNRAGGCNSNECGISFDGTTAGYSVRGMISSSTIFNSWNGISLFESNNNRILSNVIDGNSVGETGIWVDWGLSSANGSNNTLAF